MAGVDLGRVAYVPKGAYSTGMTYNRLDVVSHLGSSWVSLINNNIGNTPEEGVNWSLVAQKGDTGDKMAFSDLTQADKDELKGGKGDPFTFADFTPEQLEQLKGESAYQIWLVQPGNEGKTVEEFLAALKGNTGAPFTYDMFTPEQLEGLKGQNGVISVDAPSDGKTYGRKNESWAEIVASNQYLDYDSLFPEINGTLSDDNYQKIVEAWENRVSLVRMSTIYVALNIEKYNETYYNLHVGALAYNSAGINIPALKCQVTISDKTYIQVMNTMDLINNGIGAKYLSDNGEYLTPPIATATTAGYMSAEDKKRVDDAVVFKDVTVSTTLTDLSIENYSIKVTLSEASALSFASTPAEGWECMIDIKNTGSADITQALPNATGWQCDDTSMTIAAGKIASISVRYVHGTYVVIAKGN